MLSKNRNEHLSKTQIEQILKNDFGCERILWLENGYLAGDDTDSHIDTLARFCDENTIAYVGCNNQDDEHFEALLKMKEELQHFKNFEGNHTILLNFLFLMLVLMMKETVCRQHTPILR